MRLLILNIMLIVLSLSTSAQKLSVSVSDDEILIGEVTTIKYKIKTKSSDSISFEAKVDEIPSKMFSSETLLTDGPNFEITERFSDTTIKKNTTQLWTGEYKITVWDSGVFILPGPMVLIEDSTFRFDDISIEALLVAKKKDVELYDIKENYSDIPAKPFSLGEFLSNNWWWLLLLVIVAIGYFYFKRKKQPTLPVEKRRVSLKQRTLIAIEALENEKLWEKDKLKEHFIELSYILRSYLTTRYNISLLERTTRQTKLLLAEKGLNDDTIDTIIRILSQSDMVKFAKSKPEPIEILRISTFAKQIVAETSPLEREDAE